MNLLVGQLKIRIRELLEERGVSASVVDKTNAKGELVIAIILNEACPACGGTGKRVYPRAPVAADGGQNVGRSSIDPTPKLGG